MACAADKVIGDLIQPYLGTAPAFALSFSGSVVFVAAQRWLINLRGR